MRCFAPPNEVIDQLARSICAELGQGDPRFQTPEIREGLAAYLRTVSAIHVRLFNGQPTESTTEVDLLRLP
jgi:hypothetical protein